MKPIDEPNHQPMNATMKPSRPEWTLRIERMRESLGISQAALARRLNVSPMAVSRWERGINEPTSSIYIAIGKMIGSPECWYFWELAGLTKDDILKALDSDRR
jgi:transcriptional regulator with XRE-family HTH domain